MIRSNSSADAMRSRRPQQPRRSGLSRGQLAYYTYNGLLAPPAPNGIPTTLHFEKLTYRFVLQQDLADTIHADVADNLAASQARSTPTCSPIRQPWDANEGGLKSEFWDRRVRLNLSDFYYNYQNVQVRSMAPPAPPGNALLESAANERERGIDGDCRAQRIQIIRPRLHHLPPFRQPLRPVVRAAPHSFPHERAAAR